MKNKSLLNLICARFNVSDALLNSLTQRNKLCPFPVVLAGIWLVG